MDNSGLPPHSSSWQAPSAVGSEIVFRQDNALQQEAIVARSINFDRFGCPEMLLLEHFVADSRRLATTEARSAGQESEKFHQDEESEHGHLTELLVSRANSLLTMAIVRRSSRVKSRCPPPNFGIVTGSRLWLRYGGFQALTPRNRCYDVH